MQPSEAHPGDASGMLPLSLLSHREKRILSVDCPGGQELPVSLPGEGALPVQFCSSDGGTERGQKMGSDGKERVPLPILWRCRLAYFPSERG